MNRELIHAVNTIIASLPATDRLAVDRRRLTEFVRGRAEAGETNVAIIILAGMNFVRSDRPAGI